jgi:hypothetical protein
VVVQARVLVPHELVGHSDGTEPYSRMWKEIFLCGRQYGAEHIGSDDKDIIHGAIFQSAQVLAVLWWNEQVILFLKLPTRKDSFSYYSNTLLGATPMLTNWRNNPPMEVRKRPSSRSYKLEVSWRSGAGMSSE